jgi:ABC-type sugar transport system substrate-binding protein
MSDARLALCLVDPANDFQRLLKAEAEEAARRAGFGLDTYFSGNDLSAQTRRLRACLAAPTPPRALLVLAVPDRGLAHVAREALRAKVSFVFLNRTEDELDQLRAAAPAAATAFAVCADEFETGRIQGRQFRLLRPAGGLVLYVQGNTRNLAARDRAAGMLDAVRDSQLEVDRIEAGWTREEARSAVRRWLDIVVPGNLRLDVVGAQNDLIALGAAEALRDVAHETGRGDLLSVPVCGCDGTSTTGQRLVREGVLVATVVLPRSAARAVGLVARFVTSGTPPPALTLLRPASYPDETALPHHAAGS